MIRRHTPVLVVAGAIALGLLSEQRLFGLAAAGSWVPDALVGWTIIASALAAARLARGRGVSLLLGLTGTAWFVDNLTPWQTYLHRAALIQLVLSYPAGRPRRLWVAAAVVGAYVVSVIPTVWGSPLVTIVLACLFGAIAATGWRTTVGAARRNAAYAAALAAGLSAVLLVTATIHLFATSRAASAFALHLYESGVAAVAVAAALGLRWDPWSTAAVTDLVLELGEERSATLRDALARACGDPRLEIGYWVPEAGTFVDAAGEPLGVPDETDPGRTTTHVERDGELAMVLVHDRAVLADRVLIEAVGAAAQLATTNARLQAELREQVRELHASRERIMVAREAERERLERRLSTGPLATLLEIAALVVETRGRVRSEHARAALADAELDVAGATADLQDFARGMHPRVLDEEGLAAALGTLVSRVGLPAVLAVETVPLSREIEACLYFVCAEALTNVAKHAGASSVEVGVSSDGSRVQLHVSDDGRGGAEPAAGTGLRGAVERVEALGGTVTVDSGAAGTALTVVLPIAPSAS